MYTMGAFKLSWLAGGKLLQDSGTMFGPVPRVLWSKKYATTNHDYLTTPTDPLLIEVGKEVILVDTGIGRGKLSSKQLRNMGVLEESSLEVQLAIKGYRPEDITKVCMTHMHNDHAAGLTKLVDGRSVSAFPNATIYLTQVEWDEVRNPNRRTAGTYLRVNWEAIQEQVCTFEEQLEVYPNIRMIRTGGHSNGHALIQLCDDEDYWYHFGDILATHAHQNPLWVLGLDDYPMDTIAAKEQWVSQALKQRAWISFYHDHSVHAIRWSEDGNQVLEVLMREDAIIPKIEIKRG